MEQNLTNLRLAVLIDAENVPHGSIKSIMEEVAIYGTPTIKRIYGDWTSPYVSGWKNSLLENAITPIQQYSYTQGKNSSDSAMIIDAMDVLYTDKTDGFVIVSSDSDFTRLVIRLRESGQRVIGIGEKKTPPAFVAACDKFTYIEVIRAAYGEAAKAAAPRPAPVEPDAEHIPPEPHNIVTVIQTTGRMKVPEDIEQLIADSVADLTDDEDGVFMGELGNLMRRKRPDFDSRSFGYNSLSALIKSVDRFVIDFRQTSDPNIKHPYVKDKLAVATGE
ncbi:MAG: NYN domain-containing protein [Oscillospiraceae bacterium]|jgi:hypothetical protein|nr:NYN domain-containing protein [Oscillospiraceae bacterium]